MQCRSLFLRFSHLWFLRLWSPALWHPVVLWADVNVSENRFSVLMIFRLVSTFWKNMLLQPSTRNTIILGSYDRAKRWLRLFALTQNADLREDIDHCWYFYYYSFIQALWTTLTLKREGEERWRKWRQDRQNRWERNTGENSEGGKELKCVIIFPLNC